MIDFIGSIIFVIFFKYNYQGTHVRLTGILDPWDYEFAKEAGTGWYRSKEPAPFDAFLGTGLLSNKKWPLQEERYDFNLYS